MNKNFSDTEIYVETANSYELYFVFTKKLSLCSNLVLVNNLEIRMYRNKNAIVDKTKCGLQKNC